MQDAYDLVVIGSGPAGQAFASVASAFGHRSLIVEKNKPGGTVTTTGGAPTKTLREAALYFTGFHERDIYGVTIGAPPEVALRKIGERARSVSELLQQVIRQQLDDFGIEYVEGIAQIGPDRTVIVTLPDQAQRVLSARVIAVAPGSRPLRPSNIPFGDPAVRDTDNIFSIGRVPTDVLIIGGGPVGVEFATIFHALDIKVRLCNREDRLLPMMDGELAVRLARLFEQWGVELLLGIGAAAIDRVNGQLNVTLSTARFFIPMRCCSPQDASQIPRTLGCKRPVCNSTSVGGSWSTSSFARQRKGYSPSVM